MPVFNVQGSKKDAPKKEEVEFGCNSCDRSFPTKYGLSLHQKACKGAETVEDPAKKAGKCFKCGREGHYSPDCYAKTHVKGYAIE